MVLEFRNCVNSDFEKYIFPLTRNNMKLFFESNFGGWSDIVCEKKFFEILKNGFIRLAFQDNIFVGYVSFIIERDNSSSFLINDLHVLKKFHGLGFGKLLLDEVLLISKNFSISHLKVFVFKNNPSINFYTHLGFEEVSFLEKSNTSVLIKPI